MPGLAKGETPPPAVEESEVDKRGGGAEPPIPPRHPLYRGIIAHIARAIFGLACIEARKMAADGS
jgi:hypothetical protein